MTAAYKSAEPVSMSMYSVCGGVPIETGTTNSYSSPSFGYGEELVVFASPDRCLSVTLRSTGHMLPITHASTQRCLTTNSWH